MQSKIKNIFSLIAVLAVVGIIVASIILSSIIEDNSMKNQTIEDNSVEYQITSYEVNIGLRQNNVLEVKENITVNYSVHDKHGIVRALPIVNDVTIVDKNANTYSKNYRVKYSEINAIILPNVDYYSNHFETATEDNYLLIRLGDSARECDVNTPYIYQLSYLVDLGNDRIAEFDQFYYNFIGTEWDTSIDDISVQLSFPESVRAYKTGSEVYVGQYGSSETIPYNKLSWSEDSQVVTFTHNHLEPGEGIAMRIELPAGYFTAPFNQWISLVMLVLLIGAILTMFLSEKKYSNHKMIIPVVQFGIDKKYTSADVGYMIDKKVNDKDIASLIIFWAQKGYLKIFEEKKKTYLIKAKEADNNLKSYEKNLFNSIFDKNNLDENGRVNIKEVGDDIAPVIDSLKNEIVVENEVLFNKKSHLARTLLIIMTGGLFALVFGLLNYQTANDFLMVMSVLFGVLIIFLLFYLSQKKDGSYFISFITKLTIVISVLIIIIGSIFFAIKSFELYSDMLFSSFVCVGLIIMSVYVILSFNIRTDEGIDKMGDIIGLKNFIEATEKDRLELLAKDNPQMFYEIMPFAYVFGVYDKWCKKFENIIVEKPDWYSTTDNRIFNSTMFINVINSSCNSVLQSINTAKLAKLAENAKSLSTIGGSRGGGFSGGGFGGGGGRSW